ncbi:transferrin-binding protein-like solute binding protein [Xenorhabdus taiwanensis]|uniref:HphA C-terminal domain-containing protein n=1 Tax=Xenorhabdus taiwanensis TaxID=3085177 RepID=A0ABM8K132_9GAMM|nr:hypothetical protein TCT1_35890 [Xenorhabdus sp. TCT-1]
MKKLNILIAMLSIIGFTTQVQAKITDNISQQETTPHFLLEQEKGEIYLGEWAQKTPDKSDIIHTVFDTSKNIATKQPISGTAIYKVRGFNQEDPSHTPLVGKLTADFDTNQLDGSLSNSSLKIDINAHINEEARFLGNARARGSINKKGVTYGKFTGDSASFLTGGNAIFFGKDKYRYVLFNGDKQK